MYIINTYIYIYMYEYVSPCKALSRIGLPMTTRILEGNRCRRRVTLSPKVLNRSRVHSAVETLVLSSKLEWRVLVSRPM